MRLILLIAGCLGFIALPRLIRPRVYSMEVQSAVDYFRVESRAFAGSCAELRKSLVSLRPGELPGRATEVTEAQSGTLAAARQELIECRCHYKKIESFLEYFFRSSSTIYNRPAKYEAEEPDMEYQSPARPTGGDRVPVV